MNDFSNTNGNNGSGVASSATGGVDLNVMSQFKQAVYEQFALAIMKKLGVTNPKIVNYIAKRSDVTLGVLQNTENDRAIEQVLTNELVDYGREKLVSYVTNNKAINSFIENNSTASKTLELTNKAKSVVDNLANQAFEKLRLSGRLQGLNDALTPHIDNALEKMSKAKDVVVQTGKKLNPLKKPGQGTTEVVEEISGSNNVNTQQNIKANNGNNKNADVEVLEKDQKTRSRVDTDEVVEKSKRGAKKRPNRRVDLPEGEGSTPKPKGTNPANYADESLEAAENASKMLPPGNRFTKITNYLSETKFVKGTGAILNSPAAKTTGRLLPGIAIAVEFTSGVDQNSQEIANETSGLKAGTQSFINGTVIGAGITGTVLTAGFTTGVLTLGAANAWNPVGWTLLAVGAGAAIYTAVSGKSVGKGISDAIYGDGSDDNNTKPAAQNKGVVTGNPAKDKTEQVKEITFKPEPETHEAVKKAKYVYNDSVKDLQEKMNEKYRKDHHIKDDNFKIIAEDGKFGPRTAKLAVEQKIGKSLGLNHLENDQHFKEALKNVDDGYFKQLNSNKSFNELQANVKNYHHPKDGVMSRDDGSKLITQAKFDLKHLTEVKVDSHANLKNQFKPKIAPLTPEQQKAHSELAGLLNKGNVPSKG